MRYRIILVLNTLLRCDHIMIETSKKITNFILNRHNKLVTLNQSIYLRLFKAN